MHILLIHQAFAALDEPGGTRHHEFANFLASQGHRVTVIASAVSYLTGSTLAPQSLSGTLHQLPPFSAPFGGDSRKMGGEKEGGGVRVLRAYTYNALHKSFVHRFFAFLSFMASSFFIGLGVKNVDVVWGTSPPIFQGVTAWLLARLKRARFLFEVRDLWPDFAIAVGVLKNPILIRMMFWLERFLYRHADRMIVNSPAYVAHVRARGARSVELIPNGADPEMFDPADNGEAFRSSHQLDGKFVVMYAGAHGLSNDLGIVLESARLLAGQPEIHFILVGDGKEKPALMHVAAVFKLTNVTFLPPVPKRAMAETLAGADACIAILKPLEEYKTTYPNKVFDYMAAARPVVLAIEGVIRDLVEEADCGVFPKPGDARDLANAIAFLAAHRSRARAHGMSGRAYLEEHFSRAVIAAKLLQVLEETAQKK